MLNITEVFYINTALQKPSNLGVIILRTLLDAFTVGGITFFSTMLGLGYANLIENCKIALISAVMMGGLSFFTELKRKTKVKFETG